LTGVRNHRRVPYFPFDGIVTIAVGLMAIIPLLTLVVQSFARLWLWPALLPPAWSLRAWGEAFDATSGSLSALMTSAVIAVVVTIVSLLVATPAAAVLARQQFRYKILILFLLFLPILCPPMASVMGLHQVFVQLQLAGSVWGVILVHVIPAIPYATLMLTGSYSRLDPNLEAQARTLGATPAQAFLRVTLPGLAPGLAVAAMFAFLISWSQYILTLLVGSGRVVTLPLALVAAQNAGDEAMAATMCLLLVFPAGLVFVAAGRWLRPR
jgi:putative spermidine/putrescine transport system permease protein